MKSQINFVVANGRLTPTGSASGALALAAWLGSDIQYSERTLEWWLSILADVSSGARPPGYQGTGNTSSVTMTGEWVLVENEFVADQKVLLNLQQANTVLGKYRLFLQSSPGASQQIPGPIPFEYEAEGASAVGRYVELGGTLAAKPSGS